VQEHLEEMAKAARSPRKSRKMFFFLVSQASLMIEEKQNGERTIKD